MSEHTPVTEREAAFLHEQGWSSGFGWKTDLEWWREPSYGPRMWIKDHPKLMVQWLDDRAVYQRILTGVYIPGVTYEDRIKACVNACAGIPTEALEGASVRALVDEAEKNLNRPSVFTPNSVEERFKRRRNLHAALAPFLKGTSDEQ